MESNVLFICNTPFQLFNTIRLRYSVFNEGKADIILSDHSQVKEFYNTLKESSYFDNIYYIKSLKLAREFYFWADKKKEKALQHPYKYLKKIVKIKFENYTDIFTANIDGFVNLIYRQIVLVQSKTKVRCYEDGWVTYTMNLTNFCYSPYERIFCEERGEKVLQKNIEDVWVYEPRMICFPELYNKINAIPKIKKTENEFKNIVNQIFDYSDAEDLDYEHIFLEEAFMQDGHTNNDLELIKCISEIVGKDNFVVKRHPRLSADRYEKTGIRVNKNMQIPWEVYILNCNFKNKTLYTITSNACMTPGLVFGESCRVVYLKQALQGQVSRTYQTRQFKQFIQKYIEYYGHENFYQPNSLDDIYPTIDQMLYDEQNI